MSNTRELYKGCASKAFLCLYHLFYVGHKIYKKPQPNFQNTLSLKILIKSFNILLHLQTYLVT